MSDNTRIAKNTFFLYVRSFLMMAINLFASRIILQALGVDDYGLYGAIGSLVAMFALVNGTLSAGTSRFLTYELGKGDEERLKKTFSASFAMHASLAAILFILMETIGLWFVNYKLEIPEGREVAANMVYQFSIISCMFSLTQVPYNASIIAHEKMNVYAYVGIIEAVFKLSLVLVLLHFPFKDNLIAYGAILAIWSIGLQVFYRNYCRKRFSECHLFLVKDKSIYKSMLSYSVWDFIGSFCANGNSQGLNLLINMFFGVTMNAARTIAYQVETALATFAGNFMTSVQPQIVKSYAKQDAQRFFQLIFESGRFSHYLFFIVSLPVCLEADYILSLWLVEVPPYTSMFLRCAVAYQCFRVPMRGVIRGTHATGNIKYLNLTSGAYSAGTFLLAIYIAYKLGAPVWACFVVQFFNGFIITYFEMTSLYKNIKFSRWDFTRKVFIHSWLISLLAAIPAVLVVMFIEPSFMRLVLTTVVSVVFTSLVVFYFGINKSMRQRIVSLVKEKLKR